MINSLRNIKRRIYGSDFSTVRNHIASIEGWLTEGEAKLLFELSKKLPEKSKLVEIGSWKGKSTVALGLGLTYKSRIFAIDPFNAEGELGSKEEYLAKIGSESLLNQFIANIRKYNLINSITPLKGYSKEFVNYFDELDFIFIDGDHSIEGCRNDFELFSPKLKSGGILAFHDYYSDRDELGPTWVIKNLVMQSSNFRFLSNVDSLWVAKKI
ncbi:class I SAM-dependent methyltransferase [Pontibacter sp. CAU 1760]